MMKYTVYLIAVCLLTCAHAFSSSISAFGGKVLVTGTSNNIINGATTLTMKKGKPNVPPQMRSQYARQQEMMQQRDAMIAASKPGADGLPVFNLFVRSPRANMWYPCGSFKGDEKSRALASNYRDKGLLAGISKKQLDSGIEGSLYRDLPKLKETIFRAYPQLRKAKDELQFGYKLAFEGLPENEPICVVEPKEPKGVLDNVKSLFGA